MSDYTPQSHGREPIKTYDESDVMKSSNTWDFLIFEQIRSIRFIGQSLWEDPRSAKFKLLNLIMATNHLESLLYDKINPNYQNNTKEWNEYMMKKPLMFKDISNPSNTAAIIERINGGMDEQLQIALQQEIWFRALDKALNSIKRISPTMFEMKVPDYMGNIDKDPRGDDLNDQ